MSYQAGLDILGCRSTIVGDFLVSDETMAEGEKFKAEVHAIVPMSKAAGHKLVADSLKRLDEADKIQPVISRSTRNDLRRQLNNIDQMITSTTMDPLPETAAEVLRQAAVQAWIERAITDSPSRAIAETAKKAGKALASTGNTLKWTLYIGAGAVGLGLVLYIVSFIPRRR